MGLVEKLQKEFDLRVEWLGYEIHPETPPEGTPLAKMFPELDAKILTQHLRSLGAPYGITFSEIVSISNSRLSLEAAEFAKEHGGFDRFHHAVFQAYFSQSRNIGSIDVLTQVGRDAGLDPGALEEALRSGKYRPLIGSVQQEAESLGVIAAPTFLIEGSGRIVGAQPIEVFRDKLRAYGQRQ